MINTVQLLKHERLLHEKIYNAHWLLKLQRAVKLHHSIAHLSEEDYYPMSVKDLLEYRSRL